MTPSEIEDLLIDCESAADFDDRHNNAATPRNATLNKWERDFITSIRDQFDSSGMVSVRQLEKLKQIHRKI